MKAVGNLIKYGVESNVIEKAYLLIGCRELNEMREEIERREKNKQLRIRTRDRNKQTYNFEEE